MALEFFIKCDHACCTSEYDVKFASETETYRDVLNEIQTKLEWRIEMDGIVVTKAYCKEHSK